MVHKIPPNLIFYKGSSMYPTLKPGDIMQVDPYNDGMIRRGDVIVFKCPEEDRQITHRVVSVDSRRIRTQGDNNSEVDPYHTNCQNILGRVNCIQRGTKYLAVPGGLRGNLHVGCLWFLRRLNSLNMIRITKSTLSSILRFITITALQTGTRNRWLSDRTKFNILAFNRPEGKELHLHMGRHFIGRCYPGENSWQIRWPFLHFVPESCLPPIEYDRQITL
ncbi:signal peptidase I [Acidobacteriota bacterium]